MIVSPHCSLEKPPFIKKVTLPQYNSSFTAACSHPGSIV